ncbi:MAG: type II toxin-antitoxin system RelE/ParE family toxin [bacterium]
MPNEDASDRIQVEFTPEFKRNIRHLSKKYHHIKSDVKPVIEDLESGKTAGDQVKSVGDTVYKVRIKNTDLKKGKRAGYRLVYYIKTKSEIILITIYSKTEQGDISSEKIRRILSDFERST